MILPIETMAWDAVLVALKAADPVTQAAWDRWRHAHEALMRELRYEPRLMQAWRDRLKGKAQTYDSESANGGAS